MTVEQTQASINWLQSLLITIDDNDYANAVLDIMPNAEAFVPEIWSLEIVNTLLVAERRNRMTVEQTQASINWLQSLLITIFGLPPR